MNCRHASSIEESAREWYIPHKNMWCNLFALYYNLSVDRFNCRNKENLFLETKCYSK